MIFSYCSLHDYFHDTRVVQIQYQRVIRSNAISFFLITTKGLYKYISIRKGRYV
jgi:hypothetical protein